MMKRQNVFAAALASALALTAARVEAQFDLDDLNPTSTVPSFDVRFSTGFNYDLLRSPVGVSFKHPVGYMGLNLPLGFGGDLQTIPAAGGIIDDFFNDDEMFQRDSVFKPTAGASQNPNYTVRVDVPMLYGVGSFAYTQNFFMNFNAAVGGSSVLSTVVPIDTLVKDGGADVDISGFLSLRSGIRIPLALNLGWETMTFGYAYQIPDVKHDMIFAFNLHRHLFSADVRAKAGIDILGHLNLKATMDYEGDGFSIKDQPVVDEASDIIDFNSAECNGQAIGRYRAEVWTPTAAAKLWRFSYVGRFGINTKARGSVTGRFTVPAIVNLQTGELNERYDKLVNDLSDEPMNILDEIEAGGINGLITDSLQTLEYNTTEPLVWKMPDGHTFAFEILRNKLSVSYTKLFGEVSMKLANFNKAVTPAEADARALDPDGKDIWADYDTLTLDVGVSVDHIIMLHLNYPSFFFNVGVCAFDVRNGTSKNILGRLYRDNDLDWMRFGDAAMLPILNGGLTVGTKLQLVIEGDLLPLPAIRTGFNYFF